MKKDGCIVIALILVSSLLLSCKRASPSAEPDSAKAAEAKPAEPVPVKVLVRKSETDKCAADGYLWLAMLIVAGNKAYKENPETMKGYKLRTDEGMTVTEEDLDAQKEAKAKKKTPVTPPQNPRDFDFVVTHNTERVEKTKYSFNAPLQLSVNEKWSIEKVSDPSVTKSWTFSYVLNGGSNIDGFEKTGAAQLERVVIPTRATYVKEISKFIQANRNR